MFVNKNPSTQYNSHLAVNTNTGSALGDKIAQNIAQQLKANDDYFNSQNMSVQSPYPQPGHFPIYPKYR